MDLAALALVGFLAGIVAGMFGVGGGILFVPALVLFAELGQLEAQATSLVAIIPVAMVGAWRQRSYGNLRLGDGLLIGVLAAGGGLGGVALANAVPERWLEIGFAGLLVFTAYRLVRSATKEEDG
jgi:uncharacterized membrane protein YfcA